MKQVRFAAIGLDHFHIYGQIDLMLRAGAEFVAYCGTEQKFFPKPFAEVYPQARRVDDKRRILEDGSIDLVLSAAINNERAPLGIEVMRHGKDFMADKPGITSLAQLAEVRKVQAETKRIYSICYSEHFETRSTVKAGELLHAGAIGKLVNSVGLGPHRLNRPRRTDWFFQREKYGGILTDIASHQCEQFLFFADRLDAELVTATVANRANPETPEFQDFGEMLLRTPDATGYIRVDWFTPDGLPTWGDGRLTLIGTEGYMELRPCRQEGRPAHRLRRRRAALWTPARRRCRRSHRDRHAAGALLRRRRACPDGAGESRAVAVRTPTWQRSGPSR